MPRKVYVEEYESLLTALQELRLLIAEHGIIVGSKWKRRAEVRHCYFPSFEKRHQRFYFERPGVKRRRKRQDAERTQRYYNNISNGWSR